MLGMKKVPKFRHQQVRGTAAAQRAPTKYQAASFNDVAASVYVTSIRIPSADKGQVSNLAGGCVKILSTETGSAVTPLLSGLIMCHREATHTQGGVCV